jgi:hypothetical protein
MKYNVHLHHYLLKTGFIFFLLTGLTEVHCETGPDTDCGGTESALAASPVKKVYIHYMGWYGDTIPDNIAGDISRHWKYGHAHTPLIGLYDSKDRSLLTYHLLLSWSCGIDGIIINVKDAYDDACMKSLIRTIKWIRSMDSVNFNYDFGISYDDQGLDLAYPFDTTIRKMTYLRDSILSGLPVYIAWDHRPALFVFDYPEKFMTARNFRTVLNTVFGSEMPIVIWNSWDDKENSKAYVDAFYPWVQPGNTGWDKEGKNWGKDYLDWYYPGVNAINADNRYVFTSGGVWPGFDDTKNTSWGGDRVIDRKNGSVYDFTWRYILNYNMPLPLHWVIIETWNDWNEGTEIEPSMEDGNAYLLSTIRNINAFKGISIDEDTMKFEAAQNIYKAFRLIESESSSECVSDPLLNKAIGEFLRKEFNNSIRTSNSIIIRTKN